MDEAPYTADLDLSAVSARDELCAKLRTVRIRADNPSLRQLEIRTRQEKRPLTKNIAARILNASRFPGKEEMLSFLRACGIQSDLEPWLRAWERVAETEVAVTTVIDRLQLQRELAEYAEEAVEEDNLPMAPPEVDEVRKLRGEFDILRKEQERMSAAITSIQAYLAGRDSSLRPADIPPEKNEIIIKGRYRLIRNLSSGGMGSVWSAQDQLLNRLVALKSLIPYYTPNAPRDLRVRIIREAQAMAKVEHPAIIPIYDVFFENDHPWIVMKYVEGRQLTSLLSSERPMSASEAARIGLPLALGVAAIHEAAVVHRDIKPANVLITEDRSVFLADLGISTSSEDEKLTGAEMLVGTVEFMAPERLNGGNDGPHSDIWSLGLTMYIMYSGTSPFLRDNAPATAYAILHEKLPPLRQGRLADIISRMLEKDPGSRPDAREVAQALKEILS